MKFGSLSRYIDLPLSCLILLPFLTPQQLLYYVALETALYFLYFRNRFRRLREKLLPGKVDQDFRNPFFNLLLEAQSPNDLYNFISYAFFCKEKPENIPRQNILEWYSVQTGVPASGAVSFLEAVERRLGFSFPNGYDASLEIFQSGSAKMFAHYRPLLFMLIVKAFHYIARIGMWLLGFVEFESAETEFMRFYVRQAPKSQTGDQESPMLWMHGFGVGVIPYVPPLAYFLYSSRKMSNRTLIFVEAKWIGVGIPSGKLPTMPEMVHAIVSFLEEQQEFIGGRNKKEACAVDLVAHSYGTAVASCLHRLYPGLVARAILIDPVCFIPQLTQKSQLVHLPPWKVKLFQKTISPPLSHRTNVSTSSTTASVELDEIPTPSTCPATPVLTSPLTPRMRSSADMSKTFEKTFSHPPESSRPVASLMDTLRTTGDLVALFVYWAGAFRDLGTAWTTCRQMHAHEYIDRGNLLSLEKNLMVVLSAEDILVPALPIRNFIEKHCPKANLYWTPVAHHAVPVALPAVLNAMIDFLNE